MVVNGEIGNLVSDVNDIVWDWGKVWVSLLNEIDISLITGSGKVRVLKGNSIGIHMTCA